MKVTIRDLHRQALLNIAHRLKRGITLTGPQLKFLEAANDAAKKNTFNATGKSTKERLKSAREEALSVLVNLMRNGTDSAKIEAAKALRTWCEEEVTETREDIEIETIDESEYEKPMC